MTTPAGKEYKQKLLAHLVSPDWKETLEPEFNKPYFNQLCDKLAAEEASTAIFPPIEHIFEAFNFTPLESVRVVIIGQDPYHDDNQAHGLCFSVQPGIKVPPSLRNMYTELASDINGFKAPDHGYLLSWAKQGILMINATLTVRPHSANSHKNFGWLKFTDAVISYINKEKKNVIFALWGGFAQKIGKKVDKKKHFVFENGHPSPLSVKYWKGCKVFSKINSKLVELKSEPIDWNLPKNPTLETPGRPAKSAASVAPEVNGTEEKTSADETKEEKKSEKETGEDATMGDGEESSESEEEEEEVDYAKMRVPELKNLCKERGLPTNGLKKDLVKRLQGKEGSVLGKRESESNSEENSAKRQKKNTETDETQVTSEPTEAFKTPYSEEEIAAHCKIISWNVAGFNSILKKGFVEFVKKEKPDVICLQETKIVPDAVDDNLIPGYKKYFYIGDKSGYAGTGIFTKKEVLGVTYGIGIAEHDNEGRVITMEFEDFYLITSYIPNSGRGLVRLDYRMQWDKDFFAFLKKLEEKKPIVWCGDLNVAHKEIDLANPKTNKKTAGFTPEERASFSKFLDDEHVDIYRRFYPDEKDCYTYWSYFRGARAKNIGWRLDYFIISEKFVPHVSKYVRHSDVQGSDHCPIEIRVASKPALSTTTKGA